MLANTLSSSEESGWVRVANDTCMHKADILKNQCYSSHILMLWGRDLLPQILFWICWRSLSVVWLWRYINRWTFLVAEVVYKGHGFISHYFIRKPSKPWLTIFKTINQIPWSINYSLILTCLSMISGSWISHSNVPERFLTLIFISLILIIIVYFILSTI